MSLLLYANSDPIPIMTASTKGTNEAVAEFRQQLEILYGQDVFRDMLNVAATKVKLQQLRFVVSNDLTFSINEGSCQTAVSSGIGIKFFQKKKRKYCININKISCNVIIHEIAHMIEKELDSLFNIEEFASNIIKDIKIGSTSPTLRININTLMIEELKSYPKGQHASELFARFFEVWTGAKEVAEYYSTQASYGFDQLFTLFSNTLEYLGSINQIWKTLIDPSIASASIKYSKTSKPKWSESKIHSIHSSKKWGGIKSIHD